VTRSALYAGAAGVVAASSTDTPAPSGRRRATGSSTKAAHTGGSTARPQEYERRVVGFFDQALLKRRSP
jgi:hypothetical protein